MKLRFAMIAEYANVTGDGKLNISGISDHLFAYQFPVTHRDLYVINSLETENDDDRTTQEVWVQVISPEGQILSEIRSAIAVDGLRQVYNQVHVIQDLLFQEPGSHQVNLLFNGQLVQAMPLELVLVPRPE